MELIIRITSVDDDVEILINNFIDEEIIEKRISFDKLLELLLKYCKKEELEEEPITYFGEDVIGYSNSKKCEKYLIKQPQHQRYVTWSYNGESGGAKIYFPNSIYIVKIKDNKIVDVAAFMYLTWNGINTILYKYGMPNMLGGNSFCIGQAKREFNGDIHESLETIIYSPYSHSQLNNVKGFNCTKDYFEYLSKNPIQKKYLYEANKKLKDIISNKEDV